MPPTCLSIQAGCRFEDMNVVFPLAQRDRSDLYFMQWPPRFRGNVPAQLRQTTPRKRPVMPLTDESRNGDQWIASRIRGAAPKSVSATPQSVKPAAL